MFEIDNQRAFPDMRISLMIWSSETSLCTMGWVERASNNDNHKNNNNNDNNNNNINDNNNNIDTNNTSNHY